MPAGLDPIDGGRPAARPVAAPFPWLVDGTRPRDVTLTSPMTQSLFATTMVTLPWA